MDMEDADAFNDYNYWRLPPPVINENAPATNEAPCRDDVSMDEDEETYSDFNFWRPPPARTPRRRPAAADRHRCRRRFASVYVMPAARLLRPALGGAQRGEAGRRPEPRAPSDAESYDGADL